MTTVADQPKPAITTAQQFRNKADKIADLLLRKKQIDAEISQAVAEIKNQYPDEAKIDAEIRKLTRQCCDWFFTDSNRDLVLFEGKKSGETQKAAWKLTTGKPTVAPQEEYTDADVIRLIENHHWDQDGAVKVKKSLGLNVLSAWSDADLALCGLKRLAPKENLKIEPRG